MVKDLSIALALGALSVLMLTVSALGSQGGATAGTALQSLALWTLALVPLFISGLWLGVMSVIVSVLGGAVLGGLISGPLFAASYAVIVGAPVVILVRQALLWREDENGIHWYPVGRLILWWIAITVGLTLIAMGMLAVDDEMRKQVVSGVDQMLAQLKQERGMAAPLTGEEFVALLPLVLGSMWGLFVLLGGTLAQGVLVRFGRNIRPTPKLTEMELPNWLALAFIGLVALDLLIGIRIAAVGALITAMSIAFFLQGMAVIHVVSKEWNGRPFILGAIYALIVAASLWLVPAITILGLVENWAGLRKRFAASRPQEDD